MKRTLKAGAVFVLLALVLGMAFLAVAGLDYGNKPTEIYGRNTFTQEFLQADGTVVNYYASGDEYFHYIHDKNGYILMQEDGYIVYASDDDGRPMPTAVRYDGSEDSISRLRKMSYRDINFEKNPDLYIDYSATTLFSSNLYESASSAEPISNVVIYIAFSGETVNLDEDYITSALDGSSNSLRDYYQKISYGQILINNINPIQANEKIYVYYDSRPRSYYSGIKDGSRRRTRESELLNNAVLSAKAYLDLAGVELDTDGDGYVDAVNFLVSGSPDGWSELLWPHSWDLNDISGGNPATLGGYKVKKYSFNFLGQLTVGLLAHEFAHVLGAPDLYHYNESPAHYAVGDWDLMHLEGDVPQYMTAYLRYKYLNCIATNQIQTVEYNGVYSLKPTSISTKSDVIAYRINSPVRSDEYFMVEYRNNNVSVYDSSLPGSGLIVYRICERASGNENGKKNNASYPDELYIFRPDLKLSGSESVVSKANLQMAYLSPENSYFSSVGQSVQQSTSRYDSKNIYFTDGINSGISISAISMNDGEITFEIKLTGESSVSDDYFDGMFTLASASVQNGEYSGVGAELRAEDFNTANLNNLIVSLKDADGNITATMRLNKTLFNNAYVTNAVRTFPVRFIVNAKGNEGKFSTVFYSCDWLGDGRPVKMELHAVDSDNDLIKVAEASVAGDDSLWTTVQMTNIKYRTQIAASLISTVVVRNDGRAFVVSNKEGLSGGVNMSDVLSVSAGSKHLLYVKGDLKVGAFGGGGEELNVNEWSNIIKTAAGNDVSVGLTLFGTVVCSARVPSSYTSLSSWQNVIDIAAGENNVVAVHSDGKISAVGSDAYRQRTDSASWTNIVSVSVGDNYIAGLTASGRVVVAGDLANNGIATAVGWTNIVKISAGNGHLLALDKYGNVHSAGRNDENQLNVTQNYGYGDIVDIAAGLYHSVLLREDGQLLYAGSNTNGTNTYNENIVYYNNDYVDVTGLSVPFTEKVLTVGSEFSLNIAVLPQNASYSKLRYTSSNPAVAEVTSDGKVSVKAAGFAVITATHAANPNLSARIEITAILPIETAVAVAAGENHSVVLNSDGTVTSAGDNAYGQSNVTTWGGIVSVYAYGNVTVGLTQDGNVLMTGSFKQYISSTSGWAAEWQSVLGEVSSWRNIAHLSVTSDAIVAINTNGRTLTAGRDANEKLSSYKNDNMSRTLSDVSVSETHIIALDTLGVVHSYGSNGNGQVSATMSNSWKNVVRVYAGDGFSIGLKRDGTLYYAGRSTSFDLSTLSDWFDVISISLSENAVIAVTNDGRVLYLGDSTHRQSEIASYTDIALVTVGGRHALAIGFDGTVYGKGRNSDARLDFANVGEIERIPLTSLEYSQQSGDISAIGLMQGEKTKLRFNAEPYNATSRIIAYYSLNPLLVTVDENGYVTAANDAAGKAVVRAEVSIPGQGTVILETYVYVYSVIQDLAWVSRPSRRAYSLNESLDLVGGSILVTLSGTDSFITDVTKSMIVGYYAATASTGTNTIIVKLANKEITYDINVRNDIEYAELYNQSALKSEYYYGDEIDLSKGSLTLYRTDGSYTVETLNSLLAAGRLTVTADTRVLSTVTVTLRYEYSYEVIIYNTYGGVDYQQQFTKYFYLEYDIIVKDQMAEAEILLERNIFSYGEDFFGSGSIKITMLSGAEIIEPIVYNPDIEDGQDSVITVSGYNAYVLGAQTVTVRYYDPVYNSMVSATCTVEIIDNIKSVEILSMKIEDAAVYDVARSAEESMQVKISFNSGYEAVAGFSEGGVGLNNYITLEITGANTTEEGRHYNAVLSVYIKTVGDTLSKQYTDTLDIYGLSEVVSLSFVDARPAPETVFEYKYGEEPIIQIRIVTGDAVHTVDIDYTALGIDNKKLGQQLLTYTVLGCTSVPQNIRFVDYTVDIELGSTEVECITGEMFKLDVYLITASGSRMLTADWTYEGFSLSDAPTQKQVTIIHGTFRKTIKLTILNEIISIAVVSTPQLTYEVNDEINMSQFSIRITYKSGSPETVVYAGNESRFSVSGFDKTQIGEQLVTVKFLSYEWSYTFVVRNKIKNIYIDYQLSRRVYTQYESLSIVVMCNYENGDSEVLSAGSYTHDFDSAVLGSRYVTVTYYGIHTASVQVEVIDAPVSLRIVLPNYRYFYGELLDFTDAKLYITTKRGSVITEELAAYASNITGLNTRPTAKGSQLLTLRYYFAETYIEQTFTVYYSEKADSVYIEAVDGASGISVDRMSSRVVLDKKTTYAELMAKIKSYAEISVVQDGVTLSYLDGDTVITPAAKIHISNAAGEVIEILSVYIKGDANGDGEFNELDIDELAYFLANGTTGIEMYTDLTGDKKYTILDFVLWVEKAEALGKNE